LIELFFYVDSDYIIPTSLPPPTFCAFRVPPRDLSVVFFRSTRNDSTTRLPPQINTLSPTLTVTLHTLNILVLGGYFVTGHFFCPAID
jgi:hypothetical protein